MKKFQLQAGFTLIEILVVVAIIAIIAAIGIPSYSDYVRRAALQDGFARLGDLRVRMERFYDSNRNYGTGSCGHDGTAQQVQFSASDRFTYDCRLANSGQSFTITATGTGNAAGHVYSLDSDNVRTTTQFKGGSVNQPCWLEKSPTC